MEEGNVEVFCGKTTKKSLYVPVYGFLDHCSAIKNAFFIKN